MKHIQGLTLTELLMTVGIVSITGLMAVPQLNTTSASADATASSIYRAIQHARTQAKLQTESYRLCGSNDGIHCDKEWQKHLILFADDNNNQIIDHQETRQVYSMKTNRLFVQTRLGFGKKSFRFDELGRVDLTGSFLICSPEDQAPIRKITWNQIGRPYLLKDQAAVAAHSSLKCG